MSALFLRYWSLGELFAFALGGFGGPKNLVQTDNEGCLIIKNQPRRPIKVINPIKPPGRDAHPLQDGPNRYPNVNAYALAPESRNSMANVRSRIGPVCRTN
jgi:hypothetical protein